MQSNATTTRSVELFLEDEEIIVSKTDTKGKITYVNRTFMRISGFNEGDLIGSPHNVVRHPDMPRGVFRLMWNTLQKGEEFFGYVKNRCKDGNFYWVFANVTPVYSPANQQLVGYFSVRRRPERKAIEVVTPLYQSMRDIEQSGGTSAIDQSLLFFEQEMQRRNTDYMSLMLAIENRESAR